jgi:hypothetical protein
MSLTKFLMQPTLHFRSILCKIFKKIIIWIHDADQSLTLSLFDKRYKFITNCKMFTYSNDEKTDMILVYGECLKNASLAARVYAQRYPERRVPSDMIFKRLEGQLRANWPPVKLSKQRVATDEEHEIAVLQIFEEEPHVGQRDVARRVGISQSSVSIIANENKFHPWTHWSKGLKKQITLKD